MRHRQSVGCVLIRDWSHPGLDTCAGLSVDLVSFEESCGAEEGGCAGQASQE